MVICRLARMEQRAIGEAGRGCAALARCGEEGGLRRRCEIAEPRVRSLCVVVGGPARELRTGMAKTQEQRLVQELVAHAAVEALAETVLHWLARGDVMPGDAFALAPGEDGVQGELGAVTHREGGHGRQISRLTVFQASFRRRTNHDHPASYA